MKIPKRDIERIRLENGVTILSERVSGAKNVALGLWVRGGSRYEDLKESGMTYLTQRVAFYGAGERSGDDIANSIKTLGGGFQIRTEREGAAYLADVKAGDLEEALALLSDLTLNPKITQKAASAEEKRVLDELRELEDDGDFVLERMFLRSFWKGHGICRPPRGRLLKYKGQTKLESFKPKVLQRFHDRSHHASGLVFTAAGNLKHDKLLKLAESHFGALEDPKKTVSTTNATSYQFLALRNRLEFDEVRFQLGVPVCSASDRERFSAGVLHSLLGGGPDSRLARLLKSGKLPATEAGSVLDLFTDTGCLSVRGRVEPKHAEAVVKGIAQELRKLAFERVDAKELEAAKAARIETLRSRVSSLSARIEDLAKQERYFGDVTPWESEFEAIEEVTAKQAHAVAVEWFTPYGLSLAVMWNLMGVHIGRQTLQW